MQELLENKLREVEDKFANLEKEKEELENQNKEERRRLLEELRRLQQQDNLDDVKIFSETQIDEQISQAEQIIKINREENMVIDGSHVKNAIVGASNENRNAINLN